MLTPERINANFALWQTKLKDYDCFSQAMIDDLGEKIKNAPYSMNTRNGLAYEGAMIGTVLYGLCTIATRINENVFGTKDKNGNYLHPEMYVNNRMLMRVLLLQHISKAEMFIPQTEEWKKKRGEMYMFNEDNKTTLKLGQRSAYLCMKYGIKLCEEEFEAIHALDKGEDSIINSFYSPLVLIVRMANQIIASECYRTAQKFGNAQIG